MNTTIKCTRIETTTHSYLSVSKEDIKRVGIQNDISKQSGHTLSRVYLDGTIDAPMFLSKAKELDIHVSVMPDYNPYFDIKQNYNPALFDLRINTLDKLMVGKVVMQVLGLTNTMIYARYEKENVAIPLTNPFKFITGVAV